MKTFKYIIATFSLILCTNVNAATRYVSDNIEIYLHSGPSLDYRIIGSIKVGTQLATLKYDDDTKFMQVRTPAKKVGWVKTSNLQADLPAATLLPAVQKQLEEATSLFINDTSKNQISEKNIGLSKIFLWFSKDFGSKKERIVFIQKYSQKPFKDNAKIKYQEYDWSLNE